MKDDDAEDRRLPHHEHRYKQKSTTQTGQVQQKQHVHCYNTIAHSNNIVAEGVIVRIFTEMSLS